MSKQMSVRPTQPLIDVCVVIVTGTFVPGIGKIFYWPLQQFFIKRGYQTLILCIPGLGLGDLDESNDQLAAMIMAAHPTMRFILVGHSQGGLHTTLLGHRFPDRVVAIMNVGTPHHGTALANILPWLPRHPAVRTMAAHSDRLRELRAADTFSADLIYSFYTVFDQLVIPWFSPACLGAHNFLIAPKSLHGVLMQLGHRRSQGVELVGGVTEHVFIVWLAILRTHIGAALDQLEAPTDLPA